MNKRIIKFLLASLLISSCSINNLNYDNKDINGSNYELKVDNGNIEKKIDINIKPSFNIKTNSAGELEKVFADVNHIKIIISKDALAPFNDITQSINTINTQTFSFTLKGLKANTKYYISARVYSSSVEDETSNITEGGTINSDEYISIDNQGKLTINSDNGNNKIDINLKLKNRIGAKIDINSNITEGGFGPYFGFSLPIQASDNPKSNDIHSPEILLDDNGNGLILWTEFDTNNYFYIKGNRIKDYEVNSESSIFYNSTDKNINSISAKTNFDGNGAMIFSRKLDINNPEHIFYKKINFYSPNGTEIRLDTDNDTDTLSQPLLRADIANNGIFISSWLNNDIAGNSEFILRGSRTNPISWGTNFKSDFASKGLKVNKFDVSTISGLIDSNNYFLAFLITDDYSLKIMKFSIDTSNNISLISNTNIISSITSKDYPKISLDARGNGIITWVERGIETSDLLSQRIFNFIPSNEVIKIASFSTNQNNGTSMSLNDKGNGIISWNESNYLYINRVKNFNIDSKQSYINLNNSNGLETNISVNSNNKGIMLYRDSNYENTANYIYYFSGIFENIGN